MMIAASLVAPGCGSYEARLERTLARLKERAELDKYLNPPVEGKFKEELVFLRTPKPLPGQPSEFRLSPGLGDELYDLHSSFVAVQANGGLDLGLHVLGRHKKPPKPLPKGAPAPPDQSARGDFLADVFAELNRAHNNAAAGAEGKKVRMKGENEFTRYIYDIGSNKIHVYFLNRKIGQETYELAMIWEIPPQQAASTRGIDLCMQTLAVGPAAGRSFQSGYGDEEAPVEGGGGAF
jgi:hypothetical protein